jgi:hypothetical protein
MVTLASNVFKSHRLNKSQYETASVNASLKKKMWTNYVQDQSVNTSTFNHIKLFFAVIS